MTRCGCWPNVTATADPDGDAIRLLVYQPRIVAGAPGQVVEVHDPVGLVWVCARLAALLGNAPWRDAGECSHLASHGGLIGVAGLGCRVGEWADALGRGPEPLHAEHALQRFRREANVGSTGGST